MPDNTQEQHPGDGRKYNPDQQTGQPMYQNYAYNDYQTPNTIYESPHPNYTPTRGYGLPDQQGIKIKGTPPPQPNSKLWKFLALLMSVVAVISLLTAVVVFNLPRASNGNTSVLPTYQKTPATRATQQAVPSVTPAVTATPSATSVAQPVSTVPTSTVKENLLLSCGTSCNDPIQVTINAVQVDDANGHMIWNTTLKDVTGNNYGYNFAEYDLQAEGSQNKVPATYSQSSGNLTSDNPYSMQATFAFVPVRGVPYTLTVIVGTYESTVGSGQIAFNPVPVTF